MSTEVTKRRTSGFHLVGEQKLGGRMPAPQQAYQITLAIHTSQNPNRQIGEVKYNKETYGPK